MTDLLASPQGLVEPFGFSMSVESGGMPQIHLETTPNLEENISVPDILASLTNCLSQFDVIDPAAVKAYHSLRTMWVMGQGAPEGFVQCQVSILTGRSEDVQAKIAEAMMTVLSEAFANSVRDRHTSITVEIREMQRDTFRKLVVNPL